MARTKYGLPGIYNASPITLPDGTGSALAIDTNGKLLISGSSTGGGTAPTGLLITGGVYNTSPPSLSNGQAGQTQLDVNGNTKVTLATLIAGEDLPNNVLRVEEHYIYQNITTQTTTTVKSGAGFLHLLTVNKPTATGVITIYDNIAGSGTTIATITTPTVSGEGGYTVLYDVVFSTGLTIVTGTATQDLTVSYR